MMSKRKSVSRPPKAPNPLIKFGTTIGETQVPGGLILSEANLKPVQRKMERMHGAGKWGELELRQYIIQREWAKHIAYQRYLAHQERTSKSEAGISERQPYGAHERVQAIMDHFPDLTDAQLPDVRSLVILQRSLEALSPELDSAIQSKRLDDVRKIQQTMTSLQGEIRALQRLLRIDVGSLRGEGPEELRREIMTVMDRAKALLQKHAVRLYCPACQKADRAVNLGFLLFHFRDDVYWHMFLSCPHPECRQGVHILSMPDSEMQIFNGPEQIRPPGA